MWDWKILIPFYLGKAKAAEAVEQQKQQAILSQVKSYWPVLIYFAAALFLIWIWRHK